MPPTHAGASLFAVTPRLLTVTFVDPVATQPEPVAVTVKLYVPVIAVVTLESDVFTVPAVNEGPLQE